MVGMAERFMSHFENHGFKPSDVPKAILFHEILGITLLAITWTTCYILQPSKHPLLQKPIATIAQRLPLSWRQSFQANDLLSSKYGIAYFESSCLRKCIRPITFPGKLFLTYKMVQWSNQIQGNHRTMIETINLTKEASSTASPPLATSSTPLSSPPIPSRWARFISKSDDNEMFSLLDSELSQKYQKSFECHLYRWNSQNNLF